MPLSPASIKSIESTIRDSLRKKFQNYKPESKNMPLHFRLLGKDRMALYSFIHSLNTSFGTSIFEPVAVALAKLRFKDAKRSAIAGNQISKEAHKVIQTIMNDLITGRKEPNKAEEIEAIREVSQKGKMNTVKPTKEDVTVISRDD